MQNNPRQIQMRFTNTYRCNVFSSAECIILLAMLESFTLITSPRFSKIFYLAVNSFGVYSIAVHIQFFKNLLSRI
jgi:hypothetical protein